MTCLARLFGVAFACATWIPASHASQCYPPALDFGDPRDFFGVSATIAGDHAALLASGDQAVYVYGRSAGSWRRSARIALPTVASPLSSDALWISATGDELLVGSPAADAGAVARAGTVLHYRLNAGQWQQVASLAAEVPQVDAYFGGRLALDGDFLVVGSHQFDPAGVSNAGAAYVFRRAPDGSFGVPVTLTDPTPSANGRFGFALSANAGRLLVGASTDTVEGQNLAGTVFVYGLADAPALLQTLTRPVPLTGAQYGASVAASGARLLVTEGTSASPLGYAYLWDGSQYLAQPAPVLGAQVSEQLFDTALRGDTALIGVVGVATVNAGLSERILVLDMASNQVRSIPAPTIGPGLDAVPSFGGSVAFNEDTVLTGAAGTDVGAVRDAGVAWLLRLDDGSVIRRLRHSAGRAPAEFGASIATAADGHLWVGEPGFDGRAEDAGRVLELMADGDGWLAGRSIAGPAPQEGFGTRVALAGDLLAVASDRATVAGVSARGRVHVQRILANSVETVCELSPPAEATLGQFGAALAASGTRIAVLHGPLGNRRVHVYAVDGTSCSLVSTITAATVGTVTQSFGASIAFVGDHLVIGNPRFVPPSVVGQVFVLQPQGAGYALLTTLNQSGSLANTSLMGAAVSGSDTHLAVLRAPLGGATPRVGAVLLWQRDGSTYTALGTALDPSAAGSVASFGMGAPLLAGTQLVVPSRTNDGHPTYLRLDLAQPTTLLPGSTLGDSGNVTAIFASGDRIGVGTASAGSPAIATRGALRAVRTAAGGDQLLPALPGSAPDVVHCADFSDLED